MIRKFYILGWMLLAAAVLATLMTGYFNPVALVIYSLIALGLVHALVLWQAVTNTRDIENG